MRHLAAAGLLLFTAMAFSNDVDKMHSTVSINQTAHTVTLVEITTGGSPESQPTGSVPWIFVSVLLVFCMIATAAIFILVWKLKKRTQENSIADDSSSHYSCVRSPQLEFSPPYDYEQNPAGVYASLRLNDSMKSNYKDSSLEFNSRDHHLIRFEETVSCGGVQARVVKLEELMTASRDCHLEKVNGITFLKDKMYVICADRDNISVFFGKYPYSKLNEIEIQLNNPQDIVSYENFLFVSDYTHNTKGIIWQVKLDGSKATKWLTDMQWPVTLSCSDCIVVSSGQNIVTSTVERDVKKVELRGYELYHCLQLEEEKYIVSRGVKSSLPGQGNYSRLENAPQEICKTLRSGLVEDAFGHTKSDPLQNLDVPIHMVFGPKDLLIIADCNNRQVLMINQDFSSCCVLLKIDSPFKPVRLYFHQDLNRLYVGMSGPVGKLRIDVYEIHF